MTNNRTRLMSSRKAAGRPMSKIPLTGIKRDKSSTEKKRAVQARKTKMNSLKKKGPIFPWVSKILVVSNRPFSIYLATKWLIHVTNWSV